MTYTPTTDEVRASYIWSTMLLTQSRAVDGIGAPSLANGHRFDRWLAAHDAEVRAQALAPIRAALAGHPRCDIHSDGDSITCGWKRAVASVQAALDKEDR